MEPSGHESSEVRHIDPQGCTDLVGDLPEGGEVKVTWVGGPAGNEDCRLAPAREAPHSSMSTNPVSASTWYAMDR